MGSPTPEETANSAFLNILSDGLQSQDESKKITAIQKLFAIAKLENLDRIPNPNKL